jgi:hypothetical protein
VTSPDLAPILDVTLDDVDADALVAQAVLTAVTRWPEWVPREGNTEMVLLELLATETAETVFALNRVPFTVLEGIVALLGIAAHQGTQASCEVTVTAFDTTGYTLPAGTRFRVGEVDFLSVTTLTIPGGSVSGSCTVQAVEVGVTANLIPAGTAVSLVDTASWFVGAVSTTTSSGGTNPETSAEYVLRASQRLRRVTDSLVIADHFTAFALENPAVGRANTIDLYDADSGLGVVGSDLGHVTVALANSTGGQVTPTVIESMKVDIAARAHAGLSIHVVNVNQITVPVTVTVKRKSTFTAPAVTANVEAALQTFLDPAVWEWGRAVQLSDLIAVIDNAAGVDYVVGALAAPLVMVPVNEWELAVCGTVTVTVT